MIAVIPAQAGIHFDLDFPAPSVRQGLKIKMDPSLRCDDGQRILADISASNIDLFFRFYFAF